MKELLLPCETRRADACSRSPTTRGCFFHSTFAVVQKKPCCRHLAPQCEHPIQLFHARCQAVCFSSQTAARHSRDLLAAPPEDRYWHFLFCHICELPGSHELVVMLLLQHWAWAASCTPMEPQVVYWSTGNLQLAPDRFGRSYHVVQLEHVLD